MNWPDLLVSDLARREAVLFLGAGVSMNSEGNGGKRPPSWIGFLETCIAKCTGDVSHIEALIGTGDLLSACELLKAKLADDWPVLLTEEFADPQFKPSALHKALFDLDIGIVLTQNFDKIYDVYAQNETYGSTKIKTYYDDDTALVLRRNYRAVVKVHGTIDEPSKMVFTREEYATLRNSFRAFNLLLDALFLTHTFLFVGCSLQDPDLRLFLEQHAFTHPSAPPHFMTMPEGGVHPEIEASIRRNLNIRLLTYSPADSHRELTEGVVELVDLVELERERIAANQNW